MPKTNFSKETVQEMCCDLWSYYNLIIFSQPIRNVYLLQCIIEADHFCLKAKRPYFKKGAQHENKCSATVLQSKSNFLFALFKLPQGFQTSKIFEENVGFSHSKQYRNRTCALINIYPVNFNPGTSCKGPKQKKKQKNLLFLCSYVFRSNLEI